MAIIKNKLHIDEELGLQLKDFRNQFQVKAKDVATHIGKSAAYISKLEKGEIHQIDKEEFVKIVDFISNSENGYQLFCERIIGTMDPESLEFSTIVKNFDWVDRTLPIPEDYCSYVNTKIRELNISLSEFTDYINSNDDLDNTFLQEQKINKDTAEKNTWLSYYEADSNHVRRVYIIVNISEHELEDIIQQHVIKTSYLYLYVILYNIYKLQVLNKQLILDEHSRLNIRKKTIKKLTDFKIYTLSDKAKAISQVQNETDLENVLNAFDIKNQKLTRKLVSCISCLSEQDVEYTNRKLENMLANLSAEPSFSLAFMALPTEKLADLPYTAKKNFLKNVNTLIEKCLNADSNELEKF